MSQLTIKMKDTIANQPCFHAPVSKEGIPNNAPERSTSIFNDGTLIFSEGVGGRTY